MAVHKRGNSRNSSRRSSTTSQPDEFFDAENVPFMEKLGTILHNNNAALMVALDPKATDEEKEHARFESKLTSGPAAVRKTMRFVEKHNDYLFDSRFGEKFSKLHSNTIFDDKVPAISLSDSNENNPDLNNIIKRIDMIFEGKMDFNHPYLFSFFKLLSKEQNKHDLNESDVLEILRIKLTPEFFDILEQSIDQDSFEIAFPTFCELYVNKSVSNSKRKEFHQFELDFRNFENSMRLLHMKALKAYPQKSHDQINEIIQHFLHTKLREPLLGELINEIRQREQQNADGIPVKPLVDRELITFLNNHVQKNFQNKRFNRYIPIKYSSNNEKDIADLKYEMKALRNRTSAAVRNVETDTQIMQNENQNSYQKHEKPNNYSKNQSKPIWVENGSPYYKEAVKHLYLQYPLKETDDLANYVREITIQSNPHMTDKVQPRQIKKGYKPRVEFVGKKYLPDGPEFKDKLFKTVGTKSFLTWQILDFFSKRCLSCGLSTCFDPYGQHCPGRNYELTWSLCSNCMRSFHRTKECLCYVDARPQRSQKN